MPDKNLHVGVVGATGAVGAALTLVMKKRRFPVGELSAFASARSAGKTVETAFGPRTVEPFSVARAKRCDVVFLAVSADFARRHGPALARETLVIDNSSAFRYDDSVPLVVPEVNGKRIGNATLIANPNCTPAIAVVALDPLHRAFGLKKAIVSTYQAASGAGQPGMDALQAGLAAHVAGEPVPAAPFDHPLANNVIPHIDAFQDNAYTREEMKVVWESRKIMGIPDLPISCTCVRVPTLRTHCESIVIETERPVTAGAARTVLTRAPGVRLVDDPAEKRYPMPLSATGCDDVEVGRIRNSLIFGDRGLEFFIAGDQLLKGAALNAVQIAEIAAGR